MRTLVHESSKLPVRSARELQNNSFDIAFIPRARGAQRSSLRVKPAAERRRLAPRPAQGPDAAAHRSRLPARRCADPPAHVAMTMQSLLSPAADMPPHWLWAAMCRLCCKSLKTPGDKFPARRQNKPRSLIDVASGRLPKSPVSLSPGDEVPHMYSKGACTARRIFDHQCKKTFATLSAKTGLSAKSLLQGSLAPRLHSSPPLFCRLLERPNPYRPS